MTQNNDISTGAGDMDDGLGADVDIDVEVDGDIDDGLGVELTQEQVDEQARQQASVYNYLEQRVVLPEQCSMGEAIHHISQSIPQNEYGLPVFFYRSDYLPALSLLTQGDVDNAVVHLAYSEGYPTYGQSKSFWQQLPHESFLDFTLFQRYCDQAEELGLRQLQMLSMSESISLEKIYNLNLEYYWSARARAFDLYSLVAERRRRELRSRKAENRHFVMADDLIGGLLEKFNEPKWVESLTPKEAISALYDLVKIQRMSVGLAANGNAGARVVDPLESAAPQELLKEVTKGVSERSDGLGVNGVLLELLSDPNFAARAQALVLQVRQATPIETLTALPSE